MKFRTKILTTSVLILALFMVSLIAIYYYVSSGYQHDIQQTIDEQIQIKKSIIKQAQVIAKKSYEEKKDTYKKIHEKANDLYHQQRHNNPEPVDLLAIKQQLINEYDLAQESELFLINRQQKVYASTYEPDIGLDLSVFPRASEAISQTFTSQEILVPELVSLDPLDNSYKTYSYAGVDAENVLELSFVDHAASDMLILENFYSDNQIETYVFGIFQDGKEYFYLKPNPNASSSKKQDFFQLSKRYTKDNYHDDLVMHAYFENKPFSIVRNNEQKHIFYSALFEEDIDYMPYQNLVVEYQVSLKRMYQSQRQIRNVFFASGLLSILILYFFYRFLQTHLVKPIELITGSIDNSQLIPIKNLRNSKDEFYNISNKYNKVYTELRQEINRNQALTLTDFLTKIGNRKAFDQQLTQCIEVYFDRQQVFCLAIFDIDNFKGINDTFGHSVGDKVLQDLSAVVSDILQEKDYLFRIGGEEFAILFVDTKLYSAKEKTESVCQAVAEHFSDLRTESVTISIGLSQIQPTDDYESLYRRVDELLYYSKSHGKNQVSSS